MDRRTDERIIYAVVAVVFVALLVWGLAAFHEHRMTKEAGAKAGQLIAKFEEMGWSPTEEQVAVARDQIVSTLGTDGGTICTTARAGARQGVVNLSLAMNAGSPGARPLIVGVKVLEADASVIEIYCPDAWGEFRAFMAGFDFASASSPSPASPSP